LAGGPKSASVYATALLSVDIKSLFKELSWHIACILKEYGKPGSSPVAIQEVAFGFVKPVHPAMLYPVVGLTVLGT
jgi:hypothetical protein